MQTIQWVYVGLLQQIRQAIQRLLEEAAGLDNKWILVIVVEMIIIDTWKTVKQTKIDEKELIF